MASSLPDSLRPFLRDPVWNGNPREQANSRKLWYEQNGGRGTLVWEYQLEGRFLDAVWFPDSGETEQEEPGLNTSKRFPIAGREIVLCEAKHTLNPELIGQAVVYRQLAVRGGALVQQVFSFSERADSTMLEVASCLGISTVILDDQAA